MIRRFFKEYPDRKTFFLLILSIFPRFGYEYWLIQKAYDLAKDYFRGLSRKEPGVRYFEHLRCVTLILILYLGVRDANIIAAALLHDIIEDIEEWDYERIRSEFNKEIALLVYEVSKRDKRYFGGNKAARNLEYNIRMLDISKKAAFIKLADRLHNLVTLYAVGTRNQFQVIGDTAKYYLIVAKKYNILYLELQLAIKQATQSLGNSLL
jgi:GTP pyrophosphokinase